jgi:hypothetical protein
MSISAQKTRARAEACTEKGHCRPLPKEFRRDGFNYRLLACEGYGAIYEQTWRGCRDPAPCYEIIRIRQRPAFCIGNRFVEPAEVYPNSEAWGTNAFTLTNKDTAFGKLRTLSR